MINPSVTPCLTLRPDHTRASLSTHVLIIPASYLSLFLLSVLPSSACLHLPILHLPILHLPILHLSTSLAFPHRLHHMVRSSVLANNGLMVLVSEKLFVYGTYMAMNLLDPKAMSSVTGFMHAMRMAILQAPQMAMKLVSSCMSKTVLKAWDS
jgi:hypothetical protein